MKFNIQTKLFLLLVGLSAGILIVVLFAVTQTVSSNIEDKVVRDFEKTQELFQEQRRLIYDRLIESCYLIGENSTFKANVALDHPPSVQISIDEFANFAAMDLFVVTNAEGRILGALNDTSWYKSLSQREGIVRSLQEIEPEVTITWPELWRVEDYLFQVVSRPLFAGQTLIGTLSLGSLITQYEAEALKGNSQIEFSFFLDGMPLATTLADSLTPEIEEKLSSLLASDVPSVTPVNDSLTAGASFSAIFAEKEIFGFASPLGRGAEALYIATIEKSVELQILEVLQTNIIVIAAISLLITLLMALLMGKAFSRPILNLVDGMNQVKEGNLQMEVNPTTRDEVGLLTETFNAMTVGLRERFHLMKYVGSHTMEMIRANSDGQVQLGGERKELAVLFSDIRGFTAFSEKRTPEEVINMLNRYLGFQAELVNLYKGSVDKFVGDEMVALFVGEDAIERAVECAIRIQQLIRQDKKGNPSTVQVGIGINYGSMVMGNMGAMDRMDYTVIGAAVNLGARLCSAAAGGQILIPGRLMAGLNGRYKQGQTHKMSFKGFSSEMEIVEVLSD